MRKKICLLIIGTCVSLAGITKENLTADFKEQKRSTVFFTENKGQYADQNYNPRPDVLFGGSDGQITFHITDKGISYQLYRIDKYHEVEDPKTKGKRKEIGQQTIYRTDIKWLNANLKPNIKTDEALPGCTNYYLEQCPNGALNVKSYTGIILQNIYDNINLHYYENEGQLKYDYIVAPHADFKQIQLKVEGATLSLQKDGSLLIETPIGKIQEQAPKVYQNKKQLEARYIIKDNIVSFEVENYNSNYELIIDPVTRLWGTYYGSNAGGELANSCATDASGDVYMAGYTNSNIGTTIATGGSHQSIFGGGNVDAFLVKFNSGGGRLWGTYYGGSGDDYGNSCTSDPFGNVYVAGWTKSNTSTAIATAASHQTVFGGSVSTGGDAFLVKFSSNGLRQWGTYYGGTGDDYGQSCTTDATGNVYMAGYTTGATGTVIATVSSHQNAFAGPVWNAFLVQFNNSGVRQWATYYGGNGSAQGSSCSTDASGNVYMAGTTTSSGTMAATVGSHQVSYGGGAEDAYLVKFNASGIRQWGTYYGGNGIEYGNSCATDASGNVYLAGSTTTNTSTAIATVGGHQSIYGGGPSNAYLVQFNSVGLRQWGTYYGGTGNEIASTCVTDGSGNVYMTGRTTTSGGTVIATAVSYQSAYGGGTNFDAYLVLFNSSGLRQSATYYGGNGDDRSYSCSADASGCVYMAGQTSTTAGTIIATSGSHQSAYGGAYLVKFCGAVGAGVYNLSDPNTELIVFPNPTSGIITIQNTIALPCVAEVYNSLGQLVYSVEIKEQKTQIDLSKEANAIYFVKIGTVVKKIIKE